MDNYGGTSMLCEQGDMGLWNTPVNKTEQQQLDEAAAKEDKETKAAK